MKKILFGTSAIAASLFALNASAADWSVGVGGYQTVGVGVTWAEKSEFDEDFHIVNDGEIYFTFDLVADNGLSFGGKVEMESTGGEGTIDESWVYVRGSFGEIQIGEQDGAADQLQGAAPGARYTNPSDGTGLLFDRVGFPRKDGLGRSPLWSATGTDTSDTLKITYLTPSFSGFRAGFSASPDAGYEGTFNPRGGNQWAFEAGAQYKQTFGDFDVRVGGGYVWWEGRDAIAGVRDRVDNRDSWGVSSEFGFAVAPGSRMAVGGSIGQRSAPVRKFDDRILDFRTKIEGDFGWSVGATYETGPWGFGANFFQAQPDNGVNHYGVGVGYDYELAQGVVIGGVIEYADHEKYGTGWATGTFMSLGF